LAEDWPLRSYLELGALRSAVPCARVHVKQVLWEWGLQELSYNVELVVSELVTNSVLASEGLMGSRFNGKWTPGRPPVRLWVWSDKQGVLIQVWDGDDRMPRRRVGELEDESGRGLLLVEAVCDEWGACPMEGASGKVVWGRCKS
jgi:anti-sigma regulatory factor (Ser/Thr protein kinase)